MLIPEVANANRKVIHSLERKRIQKAYERFFTLSLDMLCIAGTDGYFKHLNPVWEKTLGFTREELLAKPFLEFVHAEDREITIAEAYKLTVGEDTISFENRYICKDGSYKWLLWTAAQSPEGLVYAVARDISDRKQAEAALQESEDQLRQQAQQEKLLNHLASQISQSLELDTIIATAVQEIRKLLQLDRCLFAWYRPHIELPDWEVIHEAKSADLPSHMGCYQAEILGSFAQKLLNREIVRIDHVETVADHDLQKLCLALDYGSALNLPIQTRSGAIGVIVCANSQSARPWLDSEVDLLQAVTDQLAIAISQAELYTHARTAARLAQEKAQQLEQTLHELQKTQSQLVQSEKMSSLGQLVAGIAHEINNPVNFIYGNLMHASEYTEDLLKLMQLYQQHYPHPADPIQSQTEIIDLDFLLQDLPKMLDSMKVGADRIRQIVLSLRNFSRLDEAEMKPVDIHEGIDNTLLILQNRLQAPNIEVIKNYGSLPLVECFAGKMNQVFMNILTNAIDALENCPELPHRSKTITIQTDVCADGNSIVIRIKDNGSGIAPEIIQRLFDPFFTTKPVGKGTGLGLAISYQIVVDQHNGLLRCCSEPGYGAEFWIKIPVCHRQQPTMQAESLPLD